MADSSQTIRKAAVLIRSLDSDTAATLLAQLLPEEATVIRAAIRALGAVEPDEQADVLAEFRRVAPLASPTAERGVELELTSAALATPVTMTEDPRPHGKRFEFLEQASIESLVPYLARERVQTIAVVLSYLAPARAAAVLASLPAQVQANAVERLSALGETDPDSLGVLEKELAAWVSRRTSGRVRRADSVTSILGATDEKTRDGILANLRTHKAGLAGQLANAFPETTCVKSESTLAAKPNVSAVRQGRPENQDTFERPTPRSVAPVSHTPAPIRFDFEDLLYLSANELNAVLREVDANVLVLALTGSSEELVDRIAERMPRRSAKEFRKQLRRFGPTRLSDVEAAQRAVANVAVRRMGARRLGATAVG